MRPPFALLVRLVPLAMLVLSPLEAAERPNIVVVFADDLGEPLFGRAFGTRSPVGATFRDALEGVLDRNDAAWCDDRGTPEPESCARMADRALELALDELQAAHGSFAAWIARHADDPAIGLDKPAWVKLFKRTFRFTGGEITGEFLMSTGVLPGAHRADCPAHARCGAAGARWARG